MDATAKLRIILLLRVELTLALNYLILNSNRTAITCRGVTLFQF